MAQVSGFFTSVGGDRAYPAGFFNARLHEAFQRADGVLLGADGELAVSGTGGLSVMVNSGVAFKAGVLYLNDAPEVVALGNLTSGFRRIDRVVLRLDKAARTMLAVVIPGSAGMEPVAPAVVAQTDILLARVLIDRRTGAYAFSVTDERQYRPHFINSQDCLDDVPDGATWKRIRAEVADALNAGVFQVSCTIFQYLARLGSQTAVCCLVKGNLTGILAGTAPEARIFRSLDAGVSWTDTGRLGGETQVLSMLALDGNVVIAGTGMTGHIFRSANDGATWVDGGRLGGSEYVAAVASNVHATGGSGAPMITLVGTAPNGEVFRSLDSGVSWSLAGRVGSESGIRALVSLGGGIFLAGTEGTGRIYRSTDGGLSWNLMKTLSADAINVLCLFSLGDGVILAGTGEGAEIHRSEDSGLSWERVALLEGCVAVNGFVRLDSGRILAAAEGRFGIFESRDFGVRWRANQRLATEPGATAIVKVYPDCVLAGTNGNAQIHRGSTVIL